MIRQPSDVHILRTLDGLFDIQNMNFDISFAIGVKSDPLAIQRPGRFYHIFDQQLFALHVQGDSRYFTGVDICGPDSSKFERRSICHPPTSLARNLP